MRAMISGISAACPAGGSMQGRTLDILVTAAGLAGDSARFARAILQRSGIEHRASVLGDAEAAAAFYTVPSAAPGTGARMAEYARHAPVLGTAAAGAALASAGVEPDSITHVVTASCTGFIAPGLDIELMQRLGLAPTVGRTNVGFMGCHAAINALNVAGAIVRASRAAEVPARVLVTCVELSSLHLQPSARPDHIVAASLFADGAGACVVSDEAGDLPCSLAGTPVEFIGAASMVVPGTLDAMRWSIGDAGFAMTLGESVPGIVREHLASWLRPWLVRHLGTGAADPAGVHWCVHPGGPRVLEAVRDAMGLDELALRFSREVLRDHGNMSSATVLFILRRMLDAGVRGPAVLLAFGPGMCIEAALVRIG
jgi:predicted naringenin-chalcone synthase